MWRRKRRPVVGFMQGGGNYGTEEKKPTWFFSHQLSAPSSQWIAGTTALHCLWVLEKRWEREHGGTIISSSSPSQPLRSCCKSQQSPELLQNPSLHPSPPIQEALEHPTIRRCRSVSHCPHKLITLAGLHVELNSWRTVPPCHHLPVPCHAPGCTGWLCSFPS